MNHEHVNKRTIEVNILIQMLGVRCSKFKLLTACGINGGRDELFFLLVSNYEEGEHSLLF